MIETTCVVGGEIERLREVVAASLRAERYWRERCALLEARLHRRHIPLSEIALDGAGETPEENAPADRGRSASPIQEPALADR